MLFFASKLLGILIIPGNMLFFLALAGACALYFRFTRLGRSLVLIAAVGFALCGFGPVGNILARPLEDRFTRPPVDTPDPTGIIVLGGAIDPDITESRDSIALARAGSRLTEAAALALHYPNAILVFSGGSAAILSNPIPEAPAAKRLFVSLGIAAERVVLEDRSRDTAENAAFTRDLINPQPGQRWLLVTSAVHMPRAVGAFRRTGFAVVPYPVGYVTAGQPSDFWEFRPDVTDGLMLTTLAIHEWAGLVAYWLTGKTDALLPGPA